MKSMTDSTLPGILLPMILAMGCAGSPSPATNGHAGRPTARPDVSANGYVYHLQVRTREGGVRLLELRLPLGYRMPGGCTMTARVFDAQGSLLATQEFTPGWHEIVTGIAVRAAPSGDYDYVELTMYWFPDFMEARKAMYVLTNEKLALAFNKLP
jgi:hypothetical protein